MRVRCEEQGGQRGQDAPKKAGHVGFQLVVVFHCRTRLRENNMAWQRRRMGRGAQEVRTRLATAALAGRGLLAEARTIGRFARGSA